MKAVFSSQVSVFTGIAVRGVSFHFNLSTSWERNYLRCVNIQSIISLKRLFFIRQLQSSDEAFTASMLWPQQITFGRAQRYVKHFRAAVCLLIKLCISVCLEEAESRRSTTAGTSKQMRGWIRRSAANGTGCIISRVLKIHVSSQDKL